MALFEKKILWVTDDCFVDHDINIVPFLSERIMIHWVILFPKGEHRFSESDFETIRSNYKNIKISFLYSNHRKRYPQNIKFYNKVFNIYQKGDFNIIHLDFGVDDPWSVPLIYRLPANKTVVVVHQGIPHEGMSHKWLCNTIRKIIFKKIRFVKMFSDSQADIFSQIYSKVKIFRFKLPLINFGSPTNQRPETGDIRFISFGTINYAKNIDLLIDAACLLYEKGVRGFKVSINGTCKDWNWYQNRIKYPEIFENQIRMIENSEIPNLFNGCHYLVQPYRVVSQSGPTKIAFQYNVPVLVSNLPGFTDEVIEGVNGYSFECGNVESLADRMQLLIENHTTEYPRLIEKMRVYINDKYGVDTLVGNYKNMIEEVISL